MSNTLSRGDGLGEWRLITVDSSGDNPRYSAVVRCPDCGRRLSLVNHSIASDGQVSPSIAHPDEYRRADGSQCEWHPTPRLLDWPNLPNPTPLAFMVCARCNAQSREVGGWGTDGRYTGGFVCRTCLAELHAADARALTSSETDQ